MKPNRLLPAVFSLLLLAFPAGMCLAQSAAPAPLGLQDSIGIALKQSHYIQAAKEGVKSAEAQKQEAFTGFLPKLSTYYQYAYVNPTPWSYVSPSTLNALGTSIFLPGHPMTVGTQNNYTWALEVKQPIFAGGSIAANYEANKKGEAIARTDENLANQDIVQEVKVAYFNILKTQKILDVAQRAVEQLSSHRNDAQGFFDVGLIPKTIFSSRKCALQTGSKTLSGRKTGWRPPSRSSIRFCGGTSTHPLTWWIS